MTKYTVETHWKDNVETIGEFPNHDAAHRAAQGLADQHIVTFVENLNTENFDQEMSRLELSPPNFCIRSWEEGEDENFHSYEHVSPQIDIKKVFEDAGIKLHFVLKGLDGEGNEVDYDNQWDDLSVAKVMGEVALEDLNEESDDASVSVVLTNGKNDIAHYDLSGNII